MQIIWKGTNLTLTDDVKDYLQKKIISLAELTPRALAFRIEIELTTRHHRHGDIYRAEVNVDLPKKVLRAESFGETIFQAIDQLKDEIRREILKYRGKKEMR